MDTAVLGLSALNAATTPIWITPRSRSGCSASAGAARRPCVVWKHLGLTTW